MLGIVAGIGKILQQKRCNIGLSAKTWFLGKMAGTEHSAALNFDFNKCRCWEELLEKCFCDSSAQYVLQMNCIWTTEYFVGLFCNLDPVLHLLLPLTRFWCQFGLFECLLDHNLKTQVWCAQDMPQKSHKAGFSFSVNHVKRGGMREELRNPYLNGSFFLGEKAEKVFLEPCSFFKGFLQLMVCIGTCSLSFLLEILGLQRR